MFILKSTHHALMGAKDREIATWQKLAAMWEDTAISHVRAVKGMVDDLRQQVHARTPQPVPKREEDEADTAIAFVAMGNAPVKRHLERYAKAQRRAGVKPTDIASAILHGERGSDGEGVPE